MDLRAPPRSFRSAESTSWIWTLGIMTVAAAILYVKSRPTQALPDPIREASESARSQTVYVYPCADGRILPEPCPQPEPVQAPVDRTSKASSPVTTYPAPRLSDHPTAKRLLADADARYRREVEAARRAQTPYEQTVAVTGSARCQRIRQERAQIRIAMRRGYGAAEGEQYRRRYYDLWSQGVQIGCWTGSPPPG